jgi:DNA-binding transcriptional regulator YiaG
MRRDSALVRVGEAMSSTLPNSDRPAHLLSLQNARPTMAKADLKEIQDDAHKEAFGRVLQRVPQILGLNKKEFAAKLDVGANQLAAWFSGKENPQMWRFHRDYRVRGALLLAQAEAHEGAVVKMSIELLERAS